ncbi:DNA-binding transcriptional regulator, GntR family [Rhodococcus rhodochrous J3]|uniref:GntR family transcriptional regulator n=2 Tax=Rhodococcus rhodochrous TaxID=1829 RepID=A0AA46X3K3_RHORH|nr:GntR family transcriptional regulator [Rhodococcus rhodochrous]MBF4478230.1 GntR family transcriptional regulator [Rhodococcus rhodochrous]MCD2099334.1 GntR family transcriptional regulator [Rhodococcus rhodochrous]MCD2123661.1 GntR family transcriptional regulator [Rhodococcus rhodochrous]MCQ4136310.1 GntR family transcriptional regulator [Rhodococcus rhodochrous]MDJ0020457.1 GntR family transcriptional regulator [Rhodococcus rhodochrous]
MTIGTPRARQLLGEEAAVYVRDQIISGAFAPGTRVRPEAVASELGISPTPAREALKALEVEGFLHLEPRRGFTVATVTGDDIRDIFLVQSTTAGELAARATARVTAAQCARLEDIHASLVAAAERQDLDAVEELNHRFHREINLAAGAPKLGWVIQILSRYTPRRFYTTKGCTCSADWPVTTVKDHTEILAMIRARDIGGARTAILEHVQRAGEQLARHVDARLNDVDCSVAR